MVTTVIITLCIILLIAYIYDLTGRFTRIPSVILLLATGWGINQISIILPFEIPDLTSYLPFMGTLGLVLIVLEGSLELELNKSKLPMLGKSALIALVPLVLIAFGTAATFHWYSGYSFKSSLICAIPFCVISSSIAIPSARNLSNYNREFITYESSLSDIIGVVFFNFVVLNEVINLSTVASFFGELAIMFVISFLASILLALLLGKIDHHIKYGPIILLTILVYEGAKLFHLPSLIFIVFFGLFIGNLDELKRFKWIQRLRPNKLNAEVKQFKDLLVEFTFLIRSAFFLLFGFLIETSDVINLESLPWSVSIVVAIFMMRAIFLLISGIPLRPMLFIAPRGLITILLFLAIPASYKLPMVENSILVQVILLTAFIMMAGILLGRAKTEEEIEEEIEAVV